MNLSATYTLSAVRERVYQSLVDPAVLQRCIPGCEQLTPVGDDAFDATIKIGIASLKGTYAGRAEIRDRRPPEGFTLAVNGKGGPGFVRATATIALAESPEGTLVSCHADVQVGGLIAAVGSRLIEAAARSQMNEFFKRLGEA
jgi:carbon monoxide dehydrogenase subunit G